MMLLLAALIAAPAHAGDDAHVALNAGPVFNPDHGLMGVGARVVRKKDSYLGAEGRFGGDGQWMGRAGVGFDVLGGSALDLKAGLFVGGTGAGPMANPETIFGSELAAGVHFKHLYGRYRLISGFGTGHLTDLHTESEITVGYQLKRVGVYGQFLNLNPAAAEPETAVGLGIGFKI